MMSCRGIAQSGELRSIKDRNTWHVSLQHFGDVHVGLRDIGRPCLWFAVNTLRGGALQVFVGEDMLDFIKNAGAIDIKTLEGKPCVVDVDGDMIRFIEMKR